MRRFFTITNVLLIVFAAGLFAQAVTEFNELGWIPALVEPLYSLEHLLSDHSAIGGLFASLVGYASSPSLTRVLAYLVFLIPMLILFIWKPSSKK